MLLRPLFFTSFLIDDQLADDGLIDRGPMIVSSASSKTAIAAAFLLAQRDGRRAGRRSPRPRSAEFVEGLGIYDRVVTYDAIDSLERGPATYVDVSGDGEVRRAVHAHFGDELAHSMAVGRHPLGGARRRRRGELPGPGADLVLRARPRRQALRATGAGPASRRGSPMPGTRSASGSAAGSRRSTARASRPSRAPTSTCSRAGSSPSSAHVLTLTLGASGSGGEPAALLRAITGVARRLPRRAGRRAAASRGRRGAASRAGGTRARPGWRGRRRRPPSAARRARRPSCRASSSPSTAIRSSAG